MPCVAPENNTESLTQAARRRVGRFYSARNVTVGRTKPGFEANGACQRDPHSMKAGTQNGRRALANTPILLDTLALSVAVRSDVGGVSRSLPACRAAKLRGMVASPFCSPDSDAAAANWVLTRIGCGRQSQAAIAWPISTPRCLRSPLDQLLWGLAATHLEATPLCL